MYCVFSFSMRSFSVTSRLSAFCLHIHRFSTIRLYWLFYIDSSEIWIHFSFKRSCVKFAVSRHRVPASTIHKWNVSIIKKIVLTPPRTCSFWFSQSHVQAGQRLLFVMLHLREIVSKRDFFLKIRTEKTSLHLHLAIPLLKLFPLSHFSTDKKMSSTSSNAFSCVKLLSTPSLLHFCPECTELSMCPGYRTRDSSV